MEIYKLLATSARTIGVYKTLISACRKNSQPHKAVSLWEETRDNTLKLDDAFLGMMSSVCVETGNTAIAEEILQLIEDGENLCEIPLAPTFTKLIHFFGYRKCYDNVRKVWFLMEKLKGTYVLLHNYTTQTVLANER